MTTPEGSGHDDGPETPPADGAAPEPPEGADESPAAQVAGPGRDDDAGDDDGDASTPDDERSLSRLRELLLGDTGERLGQVETTLREQRLSPRDVSRVLPAALRLRPDPDPQLDNALAPTLEGAVHDSVRKNPQAMADAIFPILGPAIRKAIRAALAGMVQSFNTALEHALSPRGIRWRLEAARSGRSFGEVVLMHSLLYRTEQVLLVHRETSSLLTHAHANAVAPADPDLVSAMLSAIQDFVGDSFADGERQVLKIARFEDFSLHVVVGPQLVLAALVRGEAPAEFHEQLERTLEQAHLDASRALRAFDGDVTPFESLEGLLEGCLHEVQRERPANKTLITGWIVALLALGAWITVSALERRETVARWRAALRAVDAEPGLVVLSRETDGDVLELTCLADPDAAAPIEVLARAGLAADEFTLTTTPWACLDPRFVRGRLLRALAPPDAVGVTLTDGGALRLSGRADHTWIARATAIAPSVPGVTSVDASGLVDRDVTDFKAGRTRVELQVVYFEHNQPLPDIDDEQRADLRDAVSRLVSGARALGRPLRLDVLGWSETGETRSDLARLRAEQTIKALGDALPDDLWVLAHDAYTAPGVAGLPELGESDVAGRTMRRVRFHVVMLAPGPEDSRP